MFRLNAPLLFLVLAIAGLQACAPAQFAPAQSAPAQSAPRQSSSHAAPAAAKGETIKGEASWYGPGFVGKKTTTGERFSSNKMTAATASSKVPLGSEALVTNLKNGKSVEVKVNDCQSDVTGRKVDLSKRAAQKLDMAHTGVAPVKVKVLSAPHDAARCRNAS